MKELQRMIISTVINEQQYKRISFLDVADFEDYPGYEFRKYYKAVVFHKGNPIELYRHFLNDPNLDWMQTECFYPIAFFNLEKLSIYLVENRFRKVFSVLLDDLVMKSGNDIEMSMVQEYQLEITRTDIFLLSDSFMEYLGHHASDYTKSRVEAYLKWRDGRAKEIKNCIR